MEKIIAVALLYDDGAHHDGEMTDTGRVFQSKKDHVDVALRAKDQFQDNIEDSTYFIKDWRKVEPVYGFVTSNDRFVDREVAKEIALGARQCAESGGLRLFSYDVKL